MQRQFNSEPHHIFVEKKTNTNLLLFLDTNSYSQRNVLYQSGSIANKSIYQIFEMGSCEAQTITLNLIFSVTMVTNQMTLLMNK